MNQQTLSIVIPFKNSERVIGRSLASIYAHDTQPYEVIAVNDHSEDRSVEIVQSFPCTLVHNTENYGVSSARNLGAENASGTILLFIDSDIVLRENTLNALLQCYRKFDIDGAVGVFSEETEFDGFYSQYKNLWMRYTYLLLQDTFPPFYSSVASVTKEAFKKAGGFLEEYREPDVEDTVFGNSLFKCGYTVRLCPEVEVLHIKRYSFFPLLLTDFKRGASLSKFFLGNSLLSSCSSLFALAGGRKKIVTSVPKFFLFSFLVEFAFWTASAWNFFAGKRLFSLSCFILGWILTNGANIPWLAYLRRTRGNVFAAKAFFFIPVEVFCSISSGIFGIFMRR